MFTVKIRTGKSHCCIIGVYAPVEGKTEEIELCRNFKKIYKRQEENDYIMVAGDLNARIHDAVIPELISPHRERIVNANWKQLGDFCIHIPNIKMYSWTDRGNRSNVEYIITNKKCGCMSYTQEAVKGLSLIQIVACYVLK
jgi:hypothetical protein